MLAAGGDGTMVVCCARGRRVDVQGVDLGLAANLTWSFS
jgi:hypothetical protein